MMPHGIPPLTLFYVKVPVVVHLFEFDLNGKWLTLHSEMGIYKYNGCISFSATWKNVTLLIQYNNTFLDKHHLFLPDRICFENTIALRFDIPEKKIQIR